MAACEQKKRQRNLLRETHKYNWFGEFFILSGKASCLVQLYYTYAHRKHSDAHIPTRSCTHTRIANTDMPIKRHIAFHFDGSAFSFFVSTASKLRKTVFWDIPTVTINLGYSLPLFGMISGFSLLLIWFVHTRRGMDSSQIRGFLLFVHSILDLTGNIATPSLEQNSMEPIVYNVGWVCTIDWQSDAWKCLQKRFMSSLRVHRTYSGPFFPAI